MRGLNNCPAVHTFVINILNNDIRRQLLKAFADLWEKFLVKNKQSGPT